MRKEGIILILGLYLLVGNAVAFSGGDGSSTNHYKISNCIELQNIRGCLSCNYILINDIDCSDTRNWNCEGGGM